MHGWPFAGLLRVGVYPLGRKGETAQRHFSGPIGSYSRWPFDDSPWDQTNIYAFLFNVIIAIVAAYGASVYAFKLATNEFRLSILLLLELTLVAAVLVTLRRYILDTFDITEAISLIVAFGAITITLAQALAEIFEFQDRLLSDISNSVKVKATVNDVLQDSIGTHILQPVHQCVSRAHAQLRESL